MSKALSHSHITRDPVSSFEDALAICGVTAAALANAEKASLDEKGYAVLPRVISADWLTQLREEFETAFEGTRAVPATQNQTGTRHADFKIEEKPLLYPIVTQPKVLAAVYHILGYPFKAGKLAGRDPLPGYGQQGLHSDWLARSPQEPYQVVTTLWMLDDFTEHNGPTRVVPGSHRNTNVVPKKMTDPASRHPDQVLITGKAGSVLVFNGHLWHSGTRNNSRDSRRVLQCQFMSRGELRYNQPERELHDGIPPVVKYLLGG